MLVSLQGDGSGGILTAVPVFSGRVKRKNAKKGSGGGDDDEEED